MAKVHAPFPMTGNIGDLTFYMMGGVNYVRTKSSLTRKRVLKSRAFRKTRFHAGLMSQASKIGSVIYHALPHNWRQGWMYRAFTGEALQLLKEGRTVEETTRVLWVRYVEAINHRGEDVGGRLQAAIDSGIATPRGTRKKKDPRVERLKPYSDLLVDASKMASEVYQSLPVEKRKFAIYQACVSESMRFLQAEHKKTASKLPITKAFCPDTAAFGQSLSTSDEALAPKAPAIQDSVRKAQKRNKSLVKVRLFYIPPADAISPKRFSRRRKLQFRFVSRSP